MSFTEFVTVALILLSLLALAEMYTQSSKPHLDDPWLDVPGDQEKL